MRISEKRWQVAVREAERVNALFDKGYIGILDGKVLEHKFQIDENKILMPLGERAFDVWHEKDEELDGGSWTPIKEIEARFQAIKFYAAVENQYPKKTLQELEQDLRDVAECVRVHAVENSIDMMNEAERELKDAWANLSESKYSEAQERQERLVAIKDLVNYKLPWESEERKRLGQSIHDLQQEFHTDLKHRKTGLNQ